MATQQMPPRPHNEAGEAEIEEATVLPEGNPSGGGQEDARTARGRRAMRVAVIMFVALGTGQYMQSWRPGGVARAAAVVPKQAALGFVVPQSVAAVVLTPVKLPEAPPVIGTASVDRRGAPGPDLAANVVLTNATPGGAVPGGSVPGAGFAAATTADAAGCGAKLAVRAEPDAMLGLALAAPCHGGERVVVTHAGMSVTGRLDDTGHLALDLPAMAADGAVSVAFADGAQVDGAAAVPGLAGLRRVALQWRPGDDFSLHGLNAGADIGAAGDDVSEAHPGRPDGSEGWLVRLGGGAVANPMVAEVFTYPASASVAVDAAIVARVARGSCGREMEGQTIASVAGKAQVTQLTLAMPACGGSTGYVVLRNLFGELRLAASE